MSVAVDTTSAPHIWRNVGSGMRVRVVDPAWLVEARRRPARAPRNSDEIASEWMTEHQGGDWLWRTYSKGYQDAVSRQEVPCCFHQKPSPRQIIAIVAGLHRIRVEHLIADDRRAPVAAARHHAMCRLREDTSLSLNQIGKLLGGRDHTTVLHGIRKHQARLDAGKMVAS